MCRAYRIENRHRNQLKEGQEKKIVKHIGNDIKNSSHTLHAQIFIKQVSRHHHHQHKHQMNPHLWF